MGYRDRATRGKASHAITNGFSKLRPRRRNSLNEARDRRILEAIAHVRLQAKGLEELVVQVHLVRTPDSREHETIEQRVAEQIEAAHKVSLAKAEVGIRDKRPVPKLREFIDNDFAPFVESRFASKAKSSSAPGSV